MKLHLFDNFLYAILYSVKFLHLLVTLLSIGNQSKSGRRGGPENGRALLMTRSNGIRGCKELQSVATL